MWLRSEVHLATFSSPDFDEAADQYMWFFMPGNHFLITSQSLSFANVSNFLCKPVNDNKTAYYTWLQTWIPNRDTQNLNPPLTTCQTS